jgi:hypothetical protein
MKPTRAALHRLIAVDTRITVAIAELRVAFIQDPAELVAIEAGDLMEIVDRLEEHLVKIRARTASMFVEMYPVQPGAE